MLFLHLKTRTGKYCKNLNIFSQIKIVKRISKIVIRFPEILKETCILVYDVLSIVTSQDQTLYYTFSILTLYFHVTSSTTIDIMTGRLNDFDWPCNWIFVKATYTCVYNCISSHFIIIIAYR